MPLFQPQPAQGDRTWQVDGVVRPKRRFSRADAFRAGFGHDQAHARAPARARVRACPAGVPRRRRSAPPKQARLRAGHDRVCRGFLAGSAATVHPPRRCQRAAESRIIGSKPLASRGLRTAPQEIGPSPSGKTVPAARQRGGMDVDGGRFALWDARNATGSRSSHLRAARRRGVHVPTAASPPASHPTRGPPAPLPQGPHRPGVRLADDHQTESETDRMRQRRDDPRAIRGSPRYSAIRGRRVPRVSLRRRFGRPKDCIRVASVAPS